MSIEVIETKNKVRRGMIKGKFEFTILGFCEREELTCEIRYKKRFVAEITQEHGELMLEINAPDSAGLLEVPLLDFQNALEDGKKFLQGSVQQEETRICQVCGFIQNNQSWGCDGMTPSFKFCSCGGAEFKNKDCSLKAPKKFRAKWIKN